MIDSMERLVEASDAELGGLYVIEGETAAPVVATSEAVLDFPLKLAEYGIKQASGSRLRTGRVRPRRVASLFVASFRGQDYFLVIQGKGRCLTLGVEIAYEVEEACMAGLSVLVRRAMADEEAPREDG